jgi:hypothetical protein
MPEELLERFRQKSLQYGLPVQTFAKLIMYMGLYQEQKEGLMVVGTDADIEEAIRQNRHAVGEARRKARMARMTQQLQEEVTPPQENLGEDASLSASSSLDNDTPMRPLVDEDDEVLLDAGVAELPEQVADEDEDEETEIKDLLQSF